MSDNRPLNSDLENAGYHSLSAVINARYCKRHGYDFLYVHPHLGSGDRENTMACLDPRSGVPRHGSWAKLLAAQQALSLDNDYVVYLDSDCIFTENAPGLEPVIAAMGDRFIAFLSDIPNLPELPNAGFFIAKVNDQSRDFIATWYGQDLPECNRSHPWEQGALWRIFSQHDVKILRGPLYDSWMTIEGDKGQILRHIVNQFDSLRIPYLQNHIRFYSIPYEEIIRGIPVLRLDTNPMTWRIPCRELEHGLAGLPSMNTLGTSTEKSFGTESSAYAPAGISRFFPLFRPYSSDFPGLDQLTVQSINQAMPFLGLIAEHLHGKKLEVMEIGDFACSSLGREGASSIKELFDRHGSDKANYHNYHELYGCILHDRMTVRSILEIGLGTNNSEIACNMGSGGKPGASLRAFRDFFPQALVYGADIDRSILFEEDRIQTFHVDQTDPESFERLSELLPNEIDLIVDDGLHAPNANLLTLLFGLKKISVGGWIVIEDVTSPVIWQIVASLLPESMKPYFFHADHGMIFAVQRTI